MLSLFQKISVAVTGICEYNCFHYGGNGKFLVAAPSANSASRNSALWLVESGSRQRKLFSEIYSTPHSIAFGCRKNGSLVVAALKDQSVAIKDTGSGLDKKYVQW